ncbi:hypothetical protein [Streptomyces natalensis]|uniref:Uncharacterized protein n=1 Tax=Streptomyces natalensis ATCC 27448 TaxID=1240678 RepID=A0A0D7CKL7_9ACTN|nr:hypothetical protein [Streptomyces natalensis]KIZ16636.1 hypothetical protein SNA_16500 [Streptomyces natalensis ATCC 27448]
MRERILRYLVERCGFTVLAVLAVLAFEYGFSEGFNLDAWAQGEGTGADLSAHLAAAVPVGLDEPLRGRPGPIRGTRMRPRTTGNCGESPCCPAVTTSGIGF